MGRKLLKNFKCDVSRDLLIPDVEFYQMNLDGPVKDAIAKGEFEDELPSWSKFVAHPIKAKGFFNNVLAALFYGKGGYDELNVDYQSDSSPEKSRVAMMFLPTNTRTDKRHDEEFSPMQIIEGIAAQALPGFTIINLSGGTVSNDKKVTNHNAEKIAKEAVWNAKKKGNSVLFIAAQMAQRSFSVPEITELYLAYDQGCNGATVQKMSRTLTPFDPSKVGRVYSLSFDPNRDDKFDAIILETVMNYQKNNPAKSAKEAMRDVLRTIDIFKCGVNGAIKIDGDAYLEDAMSRNSISRVIGKASNLGILSATDITALANGNSAYFKAAKVARTNKGKTRHAKQKKKPSVQATNLVEKELVKAREVIVTIVENVDFLVYGSGADTVGDAIKIISSDKTMQECVEEEFGVCFYTIEHLFHNGVINQNLLELLHDK